MSSIGPIRPATPATSNKATSPSVSGLPRLQFGADTVELTTQKHKALLAQAERIRRQAARDLHVDIDRIPRAEGDVDGFLAPHHVGAYISTFNEIHLNLPFMAKHPELFLLDDIVPHEAVVHGYLSNLRSAWAYQFPEQVQAETIDVLTRQVRQGESGILIRTMITKPPGKGTFIPQIKSAMKGDLALPEAQVQDVMEIAETILLNYDEWVDKAHKSAQPYLSPHARQMIHEWAQSNASTEIEQKVSAFLEANLPQLNRLIRKNVNGSDIQSVIIVGTAVPPLSRRERGLLADSLKIILEDPERYTKQKAASQSPELNKEGIQLLKDRLPEFSAFAYTVDTPEKGLTQLTGYLNAQLIRAELLRKTAIIPKNERLASYQKPLTQAEVQAARESFQNYLSTIEGNMKLQLGAFTDDAIFSYTIGAWEELLGRKTSSVFRLGKATAALERIQQRADSTQNPDLEDASSIQAKLQSDLKLIDLAEEYVRLTQALAGSIKNPQTARQVDEIKQLVRTIGKRLNKLNAQQIALVKANETDTPLEEESSTRTVPVDEARLYMETQKLSAKMMALIETATELAVPERIFQGEQAKKRLEERANILAEIQKIAPKGTLYPLPAFFFDSPQAHDKYHAPFNAAVAAAMPRSAFEILMTALEEEEKRDPA